MQDRLRLPGRVEVICEGSGLAEAAHIHREIFELECYWHHKFSLGPNAIVLDVGANIGKVVPAWSGFSCEFTFFASVFMWYLISAHLTPLASDAPGCTCLLHACAHEACRSRPLTCLGMPSAENSSRILFSEGPHQVAPCVPVDPHHSALKWDMQLCTIRSASTTKLLANCTSKYH